MTTQLSWLPPLPDNFRQLCSALGNSETESAAASLTWLAGHALDGSRLQLLAKARDRLAARAADGIGLPQFRLGVLSNATTDFLKASIAASGLRHGLDIRVHLGGFGQVLQDALDPSAAINTAQCDAILLALDHRALPLIGTPGQDHAAHVEVAIDHLSRIRDGLRSNGGGAVIFQTIPPQPETLFGSLDTLVDGTHRAIIADFNAALKRMVRSSVGDLLLDVEGLASGIGLKTWHDPIQWHVAKLPFSQHALPLYAEHVARLLAAMRGRTRKCLVLDLDNTVWGGVIGDDGLNGIVLGNGSAVGEAHLDVQRLALALRARGIVLAVSSKNDHDVALQPFRDHPDMLLRENHIAVFQANWTDKASNLEAIAHKLTIGIDSLVLLDDNPAERAQVRQALPMVGVPELPPDPALYSRTLQDAGYFDTVSFVAEDGQRAEQYTANAKRVELQKSNHDLDGYLRSLDMVATCGSFSPLVRARVSQLINKSNQFNLTTRRYTELDVADMEDDPAIYGQQIRLSDAFGDNGIICVIICKITPEAWDIDTWLMSCRVLGRGVERFILNRIANAARAAGAKRLDGTFIPSSRNELVRDHYPTLGFTKTSEQDDGTTRWSLDLASFNPLPVHITEG
ncbi:hypothetical protein A6A04_03730 [Paramagnetospirillum marisnigri]|uniref:BF1531-like N-terminal domain-containing protein n=1 Tax=Paramagnetospirillum marisnigri TaxID=1285242 RepID=A0A178MMC9_9PROT|nr:HAD-IIIC family phosphatase [Paramagnetospirillum marisnigri]OAN49235.1 hypothetical protein A6A04_03730 [Paramagnetospirillum marisnigri]